MYIIIYSKECISSASCVLDSTRKCGGVGGGIKKENTQMEEREKKKEKKGQIPLQLCTSTAEEKETKHEMLLHVWDEAQGPLPSAAQHLPDCSFGH